MREAGASPGIIELATIARNPNISRLIVAPSKPKTITLAQRVDHKGNRQEEVNFVGSSVEVMIDDPNILSIENSVESEVPLMTEESRTWLLDSGASYHVTPHRSQFRQYSTRHSDSV